MSERKMHTLKARETVQVTRDELYRIIDEAHKAGYADGRQMAFYYDPTVRELTCHDVHECADTFVCSACGVQIDVTSGSEPTMWVDGKATVPRFCPNCGARVVSE